MGKSNAAIRQWLGNRSRFADLFNGTLFQGKQIVLPEDLESMDSEVSIIDTDKEGRRKEVRRHRDLVMRWKKDVNLAVLACENQETVHYAMPVRNMLYDSLTYTEQMRELWNRRSGGEVLSKEEFLSRFRKTDKLYPIITLVLYYGEEAWDGNVELYDMFAEGFHQRAKQLKPLIPNYRINLIDAGKLTCVESFRTDLQEVFGMLQYRGQKMELIKYLNGKSEYFRHVDRETFDVMKAFLHSEKILKETVNAERGEIDMCQALQDLYNEGIEQGIERGIEQGLCELISKKLAKGKNVEVIAAELEANVETIRELLKKISQ